MFSQNFEIHIALCYVLGLKEMSIKKKFDVNFMSGYNLLFLFCSFVLFFNSVVSHSHSATLSQFTFFLSQGRNKTPQNTTILEFLSQVKPSWHSDQRSSEWGQVREYSVQPLSTLTYSFVFICLFLCSWQTQFLKAAVLLDQNLPLWIQVSGCLSRLGDSGTEAITVSHAAQCAV